MISGESEHTVDEDLATLANRHPNFRVVTRNRHTEAIAAFLKLRGVTVTAVHHVGKGISKASVVLDPRILDDMQGTQAREECNVMFIDDDIHELVDVGKAAACSDGSDQGPGLGDVHRRTPLPALPRLK